MKNLYVACTAMGKRLVIAKIGKKADLCLDQKECEGEIMRALVDKFLDGKNEARHAFHLDGRGYTLSLTAEPPFFPKRKRARERERLLMTLTTTEGRMEEPAASGLEEDCAGYRLAVAYQVIGALLDHMGLFDSEKGQKLLGYFAGYENAPDPLPFSVAELLEGKESSE